ncbi:Branched-chain aminotransferase [Carpediemonas membranifera]|nr:Branched-chain aminotransferase [Carpediemonas membranifera]|eukprot:KAG9393996.1 Branched-chain aminotransferase [Carpediemonas membranifera]
MKAYIDGEGKARLFRPMDNFNRLNDSCARLCMPKFNAKEVEKCLEELVRLDKGWIPNKEGYSLYLRPTVIATHPILGIAPAARVKLFVIASPVGPYYKDGFKPIKLWATKEYVRAFPGGTGNTKVGGNYGPGILAQQQAASRGCSQVLWLTPGTQCNGDLFCTEVGAMNQFFLWKDKKTGKPTLVTAPLDGTILPGITRRSILELVREDPEIKKMGITVEERHYTIQEVCDTVKDGRMIEAFGCGTAAIVTPVNGIQFEDVDYAIPAGKDGVAGDLTNAVYHKMLSIQYGKEAHPWSVLLD